MDNIKARKESFSNWRSEFEIDEGKSVIKPVVKHAYKAGKKTLSKALSNKQVQKKYHSMVDGVHAGVDNLVKIGVAAGIPLAGIKLQKNNKVSEEVEGGVSVENYADGVQFNEIETVDIIKPEPLNPSNWRSNLEVVDETAKVMLKVGKRVWKTPGVRKFASKVPGNLSRATKINPLTKSHALTKQTNSFSVKPLERGSKAGERLAPDRTTLKLDSNMGRPKPKNMSLNTETGDYVPKLKKSNYELVPGAKYGDKVMAKNYKQELKDKEFRKQVEALRKAREPKGIKDKSDINQGALKTLKKSHSDK